MQTEAEGPFSLEDSGSTKEKREFLRVPRLERPKWNPCFSPVLFRASVEAAESTASCWHSVVCCFGNRGDCHLSMDPCLSYSGVAQH